MRTRIAKRLTVVGGVVGVGVLAGSPAWAQTTVPAADGVLATIIEGVTNLLGHVLLLL